MPIRLVAVDLDGTLLRSDGTCSLYTRSVIRKACRRGLRVVIATGRPSTAAVRIASWLGIAEPVVACNGAHILSAPPREEWQFTPIPEEVCRGVIKVLSDMGLCFHLHLRGSYAVELRYIWKIVSKELGPKEFFCSLVGMRPSAPYKVLKNGESQKYAGRIPKICLFDDPGVIREAVTALSAMFPEKLQFVKTGSRFLEIMDASVNKGLALQLVAERLGIAREEIAALGDGDNDVEMLKMAGVGVAMANATPRLSLVADRFTFSCDDEGVAEFIEEILDNPY
ncbi:MAG TPA: HAD family phosphatase [Firmicutes bacterium]|nr:HAD family phosphatase [Candidatus Fermentithermobacillaceae bacterium]